MPSVHYQCVARGPVVSETTNDDDDDTPLLTSYSLAELKRMVDDAKNRRNDNNKPHENTIISFTPDTLYALQLYFQRQSDLRAKRRLMKGYSSTDLEKYGLQHASSSSIGSHSVTNKLVLTDLQSSTRQQAIDYTMKCDDGMSPSLLQKADVVLLGVSRAGKTPLSIYMAQTMGLKVANIPLVMELPPPVQLKKVNPRKVRSDKSNFVGCGECSVAMGNKSTTPQKFSLPSHPLHLHNIPTHRSFASHYSPNTWPTFVAIAFNEK